eukprot:CAMPEP_0182449266 /NCGR_PEP_ID=MMETSP1172-20130603/32867_1 /TAXON_ID=708627 /ORGANISM="Timspurckia oligopyrenoides, Strain CCMP3278" /LENGTH=83 /DNA_ID=CAMNT_0024646459 /DNA_START=513 /DNA_END=760 /DNA_ORIENTATION=-
MSFCATQYFQTGFLTNRMILYQVLTSIYILDFFIHESFMLFTWDIIAEKFGFMLVFGDLAFIPFAFSIQNLFLLDYHDPMSIS